MATLSVNLAVLNALPYPALDGGQFVFAFSELVTGKKVLRRVEQVVTGVGVIVLAYFSFSVFLRDVLKLF